MQYSISLNFKYLSKKNWKIWIFRWKKWNFELIGYSVHTTEYWALEKALFTRLYLKIKMYITNLLSLYNFFIFLRILLTMKIYLFFTRSLYAFSPKMMIRNRTLTVWLSIIWILKNRTPCKPLLKTFQKPNYLTGFFWAKPIEIHIQ